MKFKYNLGDRVLCKNGGITEALGTITGITLRKEGWSYEMDGGYSVPDSDILGTVTLKRAPVPRGRNKKKKTDTQTDISIANGKTEHMGDVNGAECNPDIV